MRCYPLAARALFVLLLCSSSPSCGEATGPKAGYEGGVCYDDGTCYFARLVCLSGLCVDPRTCQEGMEQPCVCPDGLPSERECQENGRWGDCLCPPRCGDGLWSPGEACDGTDLRGLTCAGIGYDAGELRCTESCELDPSGCTRQRCGDGVIEGEEACEGSDFGGLDCQAVGFTGGTLGCVLCVIDISGCTRCGNGVIETDEACDDGNQESGDGCSASCQWEACGNGILDPGEACDDGNQESGDGCSTSCQWKACGNGILDPGEECDLGAANSDAPNAVCRTDCHRLRCGDGIVDPLAGETCDDGNQVVGDGCGVGCLLEVCGNGVMDPGEACDSGLDNADTPDAPCRTDCTLPRCGDLIMDPLAGEQCDGAVPAWLSCEDAGYGTGNLVCDASCLVDASGCGGFVGFFAEDFESSSSVSRWQWVGTWEWTTTGGAHGGVGKLEGRPEIFSSDFAALRASTPEFSLALASAPVARFFAASSFPIPDSIYSNLWISLDGGASWELLTTVDPPYNSTLSGVSCWSGSTWSERRADLSGYAGGHIRLGFSAIRGWMSPDAVIWLDSVLVTEEWALP